MKIKHNIQMKIKYTFVIAASSIAIRLGKINANIELTVSIKVLKINTVKESFGPAILKEIVIIPRTIIPKIMVAAIIAQYFSNDDITGK
jgi:hypothetical protein